MAHKRNIQRAVAMRCELFKVADLDETISAIYLQKIIGIWKINLV